MVGQKKKCELWLVWQDTRTRLRHPVGKLWIKKGKYYFAYHEEGLNSAKKHGFKTLPYFADEKKVYKSERLFAFIASRLPDHRRSGYNKTLIEHGLNQDASDFEILEKTGGKLATDNFEFVTALNPCDDLPLNHEFYLAGWRYWDGHKLSPNDLTLGTSLQIIPERENKYDKFALQVVTKSGVKIGYIPSFYSRIIYHYIAEECNCYLEIINYNPTEESAKTLKLKLTCDGNCSKRGKKLI